MLNAKRMSYNTDLSNNTSITIHKSV